MTVFEGIRSLTDIVNNGTMSADEVVASDVPPRYLFDATTHLYIRSCPSIRPSYIIFKCQIYLLLSVTVGVDKMRLLYRHSLMSFNDFLDATTHLYKRSCPSVRRFVHSCVRVCVCGCCCFL